MGVHNPYKSGKRSGGVTSSALFLSGVVLLALTGRGYHRRREARSIRGAKGGMKVNHSLLLATKKDASDGQQKKSDSTEKASAQSSSRWSAVDDVSDQFGAAAEGAGSWMKEQAESLLGKDIVENVGGLMESGLDRVGELTERFDDWIGDDEDDDDEDGEERDPSQEDGVHPAVEEDQDETQPEVNISESNEKKEGEKDLTAQDKPKENSVQSTATYVELSNHGSSTAETAKPEGDKASSTTYVELPKVANTEQQPPQAASGAVPNNTAQAASGAVPGNTAQSAAGGVPSNNAQAGTQGAAPVTTGETKQVANAEQPLKKVEGSTSVGEPKAEQAASAQLR